MLSQLQRYYSLELLLSHIFVSSGYPHIVQSTVADLILLAAVMVVGALIFVLGLDLVKEALWDTRHRVNW